MFVGLGIARGGLGRKGKAAAESSALYTENRSETGGLNVQDCDFEG